MGNSGRNHGNDQRIDRETLQREDQFFSSLRWTKTTRLTHYFFMRNSLPWLGARDLLCAQPHPTTPDGPTRHRRSPLLTPMTLEGVIPIPLYFFLRNFLPWHGARDP